jgi:dethiobiotin synthetase
MSGCREPLDLVCPYRFEQPLAPAVAASFENSAVDMGRIRDIFRETNQSYDIVLVEGAGGLLVPVTAQHFMADIAHLLEIPVLVVARLSLGTINHSLLTIRQAQACGLTVAGIIFNQTEPASGTAEQTNPDIIHRYSGIPVIGQVNFIPEIKRRDEDCVADCIAAGIGMNFFKHHR